MKDAVSGKVNPDIVWHVVLGIAFAIFVAICVIATLTYQWSLGRDGTTLTPKPTKPILLMNDLLGVIDLYEKNEESYRELKRAVPIPPRTDARIGKSTSVAPVDDSAVVSESETNSDITTEPMIVN
jgi:hypothetical protein